MRKPAFYLWTLLFLLAACNQKSSNTDIPEAGTAAVISDTLKKGVNDKPERKIVSDSLISYDDSLYSDPELSFAEISKTEFESYKRSYKTECVSDSGNFISGSDLYISTICDEICETYLSEKTTNRKMLMPSSYDAGILTMLLSPACNKLIVCSSYDGSDYGNYYDNRAEMFVFNVTEGTGLKGIKPAFKYYTKRWSIEGLVWINDYSVALKTYEENRNIANQDRLDYKYFKTELNKTK